MIGSVKTFFRRFRRDESGSVSLVEFVVMVPLIFGCFMASMEMAVYSTRQMWLDRGLDVAVRYIRLNTGTPMTHHLVKTKICDNAGFLPDCNQVLRLEMKPLNPRNFSAFDQSADCVDTSAPVTPVRGFELGQEHELMVLRACYKFKPVFPLTGLGEAFEKDGSGRVKMISVNAFVQEPG